MKKNNFWIAHRQSGEILGCHADHRDPHALQRGQQSLSEVSSGDHFWPPQAKKIGAIAYDTNSAKH